MDQNRFEFLTDSERACLRLALTRDGSKQIAPAVGLTHHTVDKRFKSAIRKLGAQSRFEAARLFADYERRRADQVPDALDQAPDIGLTAPAFMVVPTTDRSTGALSEPWRGLREEQAPFLFTQGVRQTPMTLPIRRASGGGNDLGFWQRIGWIVGLTMAFALTFGVLTSGLTALGKVVTNVARKIEVHTS